MLVVYSFCPIRNAVVRLPRASHAVPAPGQVYPNPYAYLCFRNQQEVLVDQVPGTRFSDTIDWRQRKYSEPCHLVNLSPCHLKIKTKEP